MCMVLPLVPAWAFAAGDASSESAVSFKLEKISETQQEVTLRISFTEGKALCFDFKVEAASGFTCTKIETSSTIRDFIDNHPDGSCAQNPETGMFSFVNTTEIAAPAVVADYVFAKDTAKGVTASDFSVEVTACYQKDEDDNDIQPTVNMVNAIPETHSHVSSGEFIKLSDSTCLKQGDSVAYCTECGEIAEHKYEELKPHKTKEEKKAATCTEDGYILVYCTVCNSEVSKTVLPKLDHKNAEFQHKDATCTEDGYDRFYCPDCGESFDETPIPATNHPNKVFEHKDATCTEDGYDRYYCPDCQQYLDVKVIPATNHPNKALQHLDPTCTENGYDRYYCPDCQQYLDEKILPATNHKNTETWHKDATCTEDGYDRIYCKDCKTIISDTTLEATGHDKVTVEKAATCTEDGYYKEYCSKCDEVFKFESYPMTGHQHTKSVITDPTCTEDGKIDIVCEDCNAVIKTTVLKAEGHKLINDIKNATCLNDGYRDIKCSKCGFVQSHIVTKATGHEWSEWKVIKEPTYRSVGVERQTCRGCGTYKEREIPMIVVPVEKIVITPGEDFKIYCKKTDRLQATVVPDEAMFSAKIVWESSNPKVVSVSDDGTIKALRRGTAKITAKTEDGKVSDSINITVEYSTIQWIIVYILFGWIWYL